MEQDFLERHSFALSIFALSVVLIVAAIAYIGSAPELERIDAPPKMLFEQEVFIRRKPSDEARPWARTKNGTRLEILGDHGDWLEVRLDEKTTGWVRRDQGNIEPPPFPHPTPRQQAKQRLQVLFRHLRQLWR